MIKKAVWKAFFEYVNLPVRKTCQDNINTLSVYIKRIFLAFDDYTKSIWEAKEGDN